MSDGLFLECCREVSKKYPEIEYEEALIDRVCAKVIIKLIINLQFI